MVRFHSPTQYGTLDASRNRSQTLEPMKKILLVLAAAASVHVRSQTLALLKPSKFQETPTTNSTEVFIKTSAQSVQKTNNQSQTFLLGVPYKRIIWDDIDMITESCNGGRLATDTITYPWKSLWSGYFETGPVIRSTYPITVTGPMRDRIETGWYFRHTMKK